MKDIAIYGFGGFGREIACVIKAINAVKPIWNIVGFFDDGVPVGTENRYGRVLGDMETLNNWSSPLSLVFAIGSGHIIRKLTGKINNGNIDFPNIIAPNVQFFDEETFSCGKGNMITFGCRVSTDVTLGDFNVLNGCVSLGHDVKLGNYNVLFPETRISGMTEIGNDCFFGAKSFAAQLLRIPDGMRLGAGAFLLKNPKPGFLYMGNPAKKIII